MVRKEGDGLKPILRLMLLICSWQGRADRGCEGHDKTFRIHP